MGDFKCYNITDISLPVSGTVTIVTSSAVVAYGGIIVAGVMEIDSDDDLYDYIFVFKMDYDGNVLWAKSYKSVSSYIVAGGGGAYAASIFTGSDVIFNPTVGTILDNGSLLLAGTFGEIVPISGVNYMKYLYPAVVIYDSSGNPVFMKYYQFVGCRDIPLITEMNFDISPVMVAAGDDGITVVTRALEILPIEIDSFTYAFVMGHTVVAKVNMTYGEDVDPETLERIQCVNIAGDVSLADVTGNVTYYDILQEGINNDTIVMYSSNVELSPLDLEVKTTYEKAAEEEEEEVTSELVLPWWLTVLLVAVVVIAVLAIVNVAKHTIEDVRYSRMRFVRRK